MAPDAKRNLRFDLVPLHSSGNGQRWKAKEKLAWSNHLVAGYNFHAGDFPGGPVVNTPSKKKKKRIHLSVQGMQVQSLVQELRSGMLQGN